MIRKLFDIFLKVKKPQLGRWNLKTCQEVTTSINSIYQNRDHCGDTICKSPKKASDYFYTKQKTRNSPPRSVRTHRRSRL